MTPTVIVRPRLNRRAAGLGVNPISSDTVRIRSRVCALTISIPLIARDAVATLTPARRATSRIVTAFFTVPLRRICNRFHATGYSNRSKAVKASLSATPRSATGPTVSTDGRRSRAIAAVLANLLATASYGR
jgi:hypothetical protein